MPNNIQISLLSLLTIPSLFLPKESNLTVQENLPSTTNEIKPFVLSEDSIIRYTKEELKLTSPVEKNIVVIDAGHKGRTYDIGAKCPFNDNLYECDITLQLAKRLQSKLQKQGYIVYMTRELESENVTIDEKLYNSNLKNANFFISLHMNSTASGEPTYAESTAQGFEVHIGTKDKETDRLFAKEILRNLAYSTKLPNRGIKYNNWYNVRSNAECSVLVECGFMNNLEDYKYFTNENNQIEFINALSEAMRMYQQ